MSTFFQGSSSISHFRSPSFCIFQILRLIFRAAGRARDSQGKDMLVVDTQSASGIDTLDETESVETEVMSKASKGETLASELSESLSKSVSGSSLDLPIIFEVLRVVFFGWCGCDNVYFTHFFQFFLLPLSTRLKDLRHLDHILNFLDHIFRWIQIRKRQLEQTK